MTKLFNLYCILASSLGRITFGSYPDLSIVKAREKRDAGRKLQSDDVDPGQAKKDKARLHLEKAAQTFERLAHEWHTDKLSSWHPSTAKDTMRRLEIDIFPEIGAMPIAAVTHRHMIAALRKIESRGAHDVAHRVKATCARVFSYANQQGIKNRKPAADLNDVLEPVQPGHFAAITSDEPPAFIEAMDRNDTRLFVPLRLALRLMMLLFVRNRLSLPVACLNFIRHSFEPVGMISRYKPPRSAIL